MEPYSQKHSVPPLQIPPQAAQQTTNESITSIEEEPSNRSVSEQLQQIQYQSEKGNVQIQTQITDPRLYSYIITHAGERKTKQEYENPSLSQSRGEEADSAREEREVPSKRQLEIDVPAQQDTSLENFGASSIGSNRPQNEISPQDEDVKFVFPPTPQRNLAQQVENYKGEIEEFRHKAAQNEEEFKTKNEALQAELSEMKKRLEASEAEKTALKAVVDKQKNIKKASISIGTDKTAMHKNTQTDESASAASQKMKTIEQKLKVAEKDKADLASTLEKQRTLLMKAESELTNSAKETHALALELEAARQGYESQKKIVASLKSDINSYKAKALRLETENKELLQRGRRTYQPEEKQELREKLSRFEQLSIELSKENEMHKAVVNELKDQLHRVTEKLEHKKVKSKKRKGKVKELKKESDLLKMEVLKVKQMYSDKCEGYKEARNRLQKKLKEREETILSLQNAVGEKKINGKVHQEPIFEWPNNKPEIENEDYIRAKSLENTHKYQFKDLSATLQPGEIRKKLENDQFSVDEQIRADEKAALRSKEEINDFISTHKLREMPGFGERYKYTPEGNSNKRHLEHIEERLEQFKSRKAEIDSKLSSNEKFTTKLGAKADPVWKKYQMQPSRAQPLDASRTRKTTSLHSDIISGAQGSTSTGDVSATKHSKAAHKDPGTKKGSRPPSGAKQEYQKNVPVKARDCTPQMARAHVAPVGLYSPNDNVNKGGMWLGQLSPSTKAGTGHEQMENILIQTLSPRGLKFYGEQNPPVAWREPKSTQHKDLVFGRGKMEQKEEPRVGEIYSRGNLGAKKGHLFGSQHGESGKPTAATKYQTQTRKTPVYESVMDRHPAKHHGFEKRKQYYY